MPRNMYLRVLDRELPCTVFSSSMASARVIANVKANFFLDLKRPNTRLALRWCFKRQDKAEPMTFFVPCRATGFTHFNVQKPGVQMMTLMFTQKPPNDLIEILGGLLEANWNSQQRREERIPITPENMKKLGMESRDATLRIGETSRPCLLRDLSFIGAEVLVPGLTRIGFRKTGEPEHREGGAGHGHDGPGNNHPGGGSRRKKRYQGGGNRVCIRDADQLQAPDKLFCHLPQGGQGRGPGPCPRAAGGTAPGGRLFPPPDTGQMEQFLSSPPHPKLPDPDGKSSPNG